jgi:hypothetical protein
MRARPDRHSARRTLARALRAAARLAEPPPSKTLDAETDMRPGGYPRADAIHARLHLYDSLSDYDSRLSKLIEYFGWETGHKADACRRWFFGDDVKQQRFLEAMGLSVWEYAVMHQYAQFNRFDPERPDMYWLYDEVVERLDRLGGRDLICRLRLRARADPVPGDVFVTTTLERDWTDELKEFYIRDAGDTAQAEQLWGDEIRELVDERFDVVRRPETLAAVLVRRG